MKIAAIILALALPVVAQTPKPAEPAKAGPAAPVVPVEIREKFFKSRSEAQEAQQAMVNAQQVLQAKTATFQEHLKKAQDACGTNFNLTVDAEGELVCVAKTPEPAKPAVAPPPAKVVPPSSVTPPPAAKE